MSEIKQLHQLLEEMVKSATNGDKEKVLELNRRYEQLVPRAYHKPPTKLDLEYDNCRQSCVMSVTMLKDFNERLIETMRAQQQESD